MRLRVRSIHDCQINNFPLKQHLLYYAKVVLLKKAQSPLHKTALFLRVYYLKLPRPKYHLPILDNR